jgi:D-alanine-D-alanine ligase
MTRKRRLRVALIYNSHAGSTPDRPGDLGGTADLRIMIRHLARALRSTGCEVVTLSLHDDLLGFQRRLRRIEPDVVFNQYEDVVHGASYEMRVAATVRMMGYPMTGSPALALGLHRDKYMAASLFQGVGIPIPPQTSLLERIGDIDQRKWQFPVIVQASREHAGVGLDRQSVVASKRALRERVANVIRTFRQPALVQSFLPGREFNVSLIGGRRIQVLPLAEVDYSLLPPAIPWIMSYAAKFIESSAEYRATSVICPAVVQAELAREIGAIALRAFRAVGGWGYGRVDMRLDSRGSPRVLEVNCNPCLEEGVALARSALAAGIGYPQLLRLIIKAAFDGPPYDALVPMLGARSIRSSGAEMGAPRS